MKWEFTPDEFIHLWKETGQDRYPPPLRLRSSAQWRDDHTRLTTTLNARLHRDDPDLTAALRLSAHPDSALTLTGLRRHPLRAYAAVTNDIAVTLVQRPSTRTDTGGNIIIESGTPPLIVSVFSAVLGTAPPGTVQSATTPSPIDHDPAARAETFSPPANPNIATAEADHHRPHRITPLPPRGREIADTRPPDLARILRLAHTRPSAHGDLTARHHLRTDHPTPPRHLHWFDVTGDGRYTVHHRNGHLHITPCSPDTLRRCIIQLLR
ncbi:ESX secretion-associated protein EspG [Nocardia inohanensis]|uniref:ESX secretion-associated protein EspG n=1 Tax=Nocardia inohanensis TaxID=209246 RepID=UPI00082D56F8|nr:ESX secretion-associated protein EspG [Nocardia inohanensis]